MGRIYQGAETVIVWLGQISRFGESCIAALDERAGVYKQANYNLVKLGATTVILSQWYA